MKRSQTAYADFSFLVDTLPDSSLGAASDPPTDPKLTDRADLDTITEGNYSSASAISLMPMKQSWHRREHNKRH